MRTTDYNAIDARARELLASSSINSAPVPVDQVALSQGLSLQAADLGDDVSGILVIEESSGAIGYNMYQARVRQRFSIAHELGHYVLHAEEQCLFIDKRYNVFLRDGQSATGEQQLEREANHFAACLLMPADFILEELGGVNQDQDDDGILHELAERFDVSAHAMALRLARLGIMDLTDTFQ